MKNGQKEHWPPRPPFNPATGSGLLFESGAVLHERGGPAVALVESLLLAAFYAATLRMSPAEFAFAAQSTLEGAGKDTGAREAITMLVEQHCGERFMFDDEEETTDEADR